MFSESWCPGCFSRSARTAASASKGNAPEPVPHPAELRPLPRARRRHRASARCVQPRGPAPHRPDPATWPDEQASVAWLGHATSLGNLLRALVSHRSGAGDRSESDVGAPSRPRRLTAPALEPRELPRLDLLLLSHAHMDHTDLGTLAASPRDVPVVVQPGNRDLVRRFRKVIELGWGDHAEVGGIAVESVEVRHWGARLITDGIGATAGTCCGGRAGPSSLPATPHTPRRSRRSGGAAR